MEFTQVHEGELGARVQDVAQEAVDATETLRQHLHARGLAAASDADLEQVATSIRSGHAVELGEHDGSID